MITGFTELKKIILISVFVLVSLLAPSVASSHPHLFLDTTASFKLDDKKQLKSVVLRFVVDELNTALTIATVGIDQDGDKVLTDEDKKKVSKTILEGFSRYSFFTYLAVDDNDLVFNPPSHMDVGILNGHLVINMEMKLSKPFSVSGKTFTLELYDPTYFTEVKIKEVPQIIGGSKQCKVEFDKTELDQRMSQLQTSLFQLSREEVPEIENVGELFADKTRLVCA